MESKLICTQKNGFIDCRAGGATKTWVYPGLELKTSRFTAELASHSATGEILFISPPFIAQLPAYPPFNFLKINFFS